MKKTLLTLAISLTLASPLSFAANSDCASNAANDYRKNADARFAAHQAEMQKMREAFRSQRPAASGFQTVAQSQDWNTWNEQQRQHMEAQAKAQQEQFAAFQKQQAEYLKNRQERVAQQPAQPSYEEIQKAQQARIDQIRAQQDKQLKALREQAAQFQPQQHPQAAQSVADARKAHQAFAEQLRQQQVQHMQAMQQQMPSSMPGMQTVDFAQMEELRHKTPEQRRDYFKSLAEKQKIHAQAEFAKFENKMKDMREQFEQQHPVAHFPQQQAFQAEFDKRRADSEKRRMDARQRAEARKACMSNT